MTNNLQARGNLLLGAALVVLSASCFGTMGLFSRFAYRDGVTPESLLFLRFASAAPALALLAWWRGGAWPRGWAAVLALVMGGVFVGNSLAYFMALQLAPAGTVAIVFFSYPVIVALVARVLFAERLGPRKLVALALAVAGCMAVVGGPSELHAARGALLALVASVVYAAYVLLARRVAPGVDPFAQASVITGTAALTFGGMVAWQGLSLPASAAGWTGVAAIALLATVGAISMFLIGVRRLGATGAATLSAAEPIVAASLGALFLDEPLRAGSIAGIAMVIGATVLTVTDKPPRQPG